MFRKIWSKNPRRAHHNRVLLVAVVLLAVSCGLPRDIEGTTETVVSRGRIEAGVVAGADTVVVDADGNPTGREINGVRTLADSLGVGVDWHFGTEGELLARLEEGGVDVVVGGIKQSSPWAGRVAFSGPISGEGEDPLVAAFRNGENRWLRMWELSQQP